MSRYWGAACLLLAATPWGFSSDPAASRFEFAQPHMGTMFRIVLYAPDQTTATRASNAAFDRIAELDHIMSDYRRSGELMLLCQKSGGPPVKVSEDLFRVLEKSQEVASKSEGAFDITVGPLVRLWRRARRQHEKPDPEDLAQALRLVGYKNLRLNSEARTAQLLKQGMLLDLGGVAKGDAADQALLVLKRFGISSALVAGGGDIAVSSPPPRRKGWRIAIALPETPNDGKNRSDIQNPKTEHRDAQAQFVYLHDAGISTSGDAEQHVEIGGVRYSHILNPKTGMPLTGRNSVTVIAPNDITADALATAVSVLGSERGLQLIESIPDAAASITVMTERGPMTFKKRFPPEVARLR